MNLTSTMPRQIIPRLEDSVSRLGVARKASKTPILNTAFPERGSFPKLCSTSIFPTNEALTFFLLPFSNLRAYLISMGQSSTYLIILISFVILHSLHPPHPRRGDLCHHWQAFTQRILYSQSSHLFLIDCQILVCGS